MQRISNFATGLLTLLLLTAAYPVLSADAQEDQPKQTVEPVFRVPKIKRSASPKTPADKPEDTETVPAPVAPQNFSTQPVVQPQPVNNNAVAVPFRSNPAPVARVADARSATVVPDKAKTELVPNLDPAADPNAHPLDRAIQIAHDGLSNMRATINDYTAVLVKRERVGNKLSEPIFMKIKVRNPRQVASQNVPFSIYMKFVKPRSVVGREVIWVEGHNENNLIVHDTNPLVRFRNLHLEPNGFLAMKGNKYPIYEAGLEKLVLKLIEKAERDRAAGVCEVNYQEGATINRRSCTLIEVVHNQRRAPYEFHRAKVYIDDEYQIPVRFAAYDWPVGNQKPQLIEEYTYVNVALNVGLQDSDFDIANRAYNFAR